MRYMGFVSMASDQGEPPAALMEAMDTYVQKGIADGVFVDGGGLYATSFRAQIRVRAGQITTFDGPFTESKEEVGGYSILEFRDHDEALEGARELAQLHAEHWPAWVGTVEVRRIAGPDEVGGA